MHTDVYNYAIREVDDSDESDLESLYPLLCSITYTSDHLFCSQDFPGLIYIIASIV